MYYHFKRLIDKYSRPFKLVLKGAVTYDSLGDCVYAQDTEYDLYGAVIGYTENKVYRSEGHYTSMDKALYMVTPLDDALTKGTVIFNGCEYTITAVKRQDDSYFTGVYGYSLRYTGKAVADDDTNDGNQNSNSE